MERRFIHYSFHWQLRLTRRQEWGGGQQKERDGNEKVSWVEQHWQGGATLFRFCLCVQMYCCPSKTQAGINSLQKTKGPFYWKFCLDKIFLPLCSAGFCSQEGSCFEPELVTHTHTRTHLNREVLSDQQSGGFFSGAIWKRYIQYWKWSFLFSALFIWMRLD